MLFYLLIEAFFTYRTMNNIENPWNVENLEEFLYFCCPECDLKDQSKMQFLQHALNQHPNAKGSVQKFIIKEETFEDSEEFPYLNDINIHKIISPIVLHKSAHSSRVVIRSVFIVNSVLSA